MYASHDCGAAILSAANRMSELSTHLRSNPRKPKLIQTIFETAIALDEVGHRIGMEELRKLSVRLVSAAKSELLAEAGDSHWDSVVSKLFEISEEVDCESPQKAQ